MTAPLGDVINPTSPGVAGSGFSVEIGEPFRDQFGFQCLKPGFLVTDTSLGHVLDDQLKPSVGRIKIHLAPDSYLKSVSCDESN